MARWKITKAYKTKDTSAYLDTRMIAARARACMVAGASSYGECTKAKGSYDMVFKT